MLATNVSSEQLVSIIAQGNKEVLSKLIEINGPNFYVEEKQDNGKVLFLTPLSIAASHLCTERSDMVQYLYKAGADFNYFPMPTGFQSIKEFKHDTTGYVLRILSYLSKGEWVAEHYDSLVKTLLTRGVKTSNSKRDMDVYRFALHADVAGPDTLEQKFSVNVKRDYGRNNNLLVQLENSFDLGTVKYLMEQGSVLENEENGSLLLFTLDPNVATYMIEEGYNVNIANEHGVTPLMRFASWGNRELISLAISKGADTEATDLEGKTALDYGLQSNRSLVALSGLHSKKVLHGKSKSYTLPELLAMIQEDQDNVLEAHMKTYDSIETQEGILDSLAELRDLLSVFGAHPILVNKYWDVVTRYALSLPEGTREVPRSVYKLSREVMQASMTVPSWARYVDVSFDLAK